MNYRLHPMTQINNNHVLLFLAFLTSITLHNHGTVAQIQTPCHICRRDDRSVVNTDHAFQMPNEHGVKFDWTCGELETWAEANLKVSNTICGIAVTWAEQECTCNGPPIDPVQIIDNSPACNICIDSRGIPPQLVDELVDTGVAGLMPCGFLYETSASGYLPGSYCQTLQDNVADFCCTPPGLDPDSEPEVETEAPTESTCAELYAPCSAEEPCCEPYDCKLRFIGGDKVCSSRAVRKRQSIAGTGRGGAGGKAKYVN